MEKITFKKIKHHWAELAVIVFAFVYSIYFNIASFLRYDNYYTGRFDLGNMAQTVWNTTQGNLFTLTDPNGTREVSRLAFHADFILVLLSPFYALWQDPRMLLFIQTLVLSLGGIFVYLIARQTLENRTLSVVLSLCYFLNPAVQYTNLYDFHSVTLATTFLLAAFYFIQKKYFTLTLIFLILAGITKEQVWFITALMGLYILFISKQRKLGLLIFTSSTFLFYYLIWIAIPHSLGSAHFALEYYSDFGSSPGDIIKNIFLHPIQTVQTLLLPDRIGYLKQLFLPLGYLSFLAPIYLIFAGPDIGINLLSTNPTLHQIYYQYSSTVTPFIFISAIFAIKYIIKFIPEIPYLAFGVLIFMTTLISAYTYGPLPGALKPNLDMFNKPLLIRSVIDEQINEIPEEESVSASNNLASHLSHRKNIYVVPYGIGQADKVLFLITKSANEYEKKALENILQDPNFSLIYHQDNFYVFKRLSS